MKKLILFCLLFCFSVTLNATHINGGYITYRYLGNNNYVIELIVYRDCYNGVPPFDNPASIGIFDVNNSLLQNQLVPIVSITPLFTPSDCIPNNICFERGSYLDTVNIPASNLPVTIAYQRCCRSGLVGNIANPLDVGMTFLATINTAGNSNPFFNGEIPGFTYVGDNFIYNASAYDLDGDSLVYSLADFYDGAESVACAIIPQQPCGPQPSPPFNPPYANALWQAPFSLANVIGGTTPLSIDSNTGIMTAIPGLVGVFQVAEKVEEYRNGLWINATHREFQLFINPANYFNFSGNVSVNNNTQSLNIGKSWLIRKNLYDSMLTATDTNIVSSGSYSFSNTINGVYLVKASADSISPYYPNNIPTYFGDVLFWYQATDLDLCLMDTSGININLVQGINPGGPGFVDGLISQGANRMMSPGDPEGGITIILFNSTNQPVAYAITDSTGYFYIGNLPLGSYKVYVDKLNSWINNGVAPIVTLTSSNTGYNNFSFTLFSDHLELNGSLNVQNTIDRQDFVSIIPNPANKKTILKYHLNEKSDILIDICDVFGRKVKSIFENNQDAGDHIYELNFQKENMTDGVYFIFLKSKKFSKTIRLVVK